MKPTKSIVRQVITLVKNSSRAGKFSHFRKHHTCFGGYMQNGPRNHGPLYNDRNKTQGNYLTSKQSS